MMKALMPLTDYLGPLAWILLSTYWMLRKPSQSWSKSGRRFPRKSIRWLISSVPGRCLECIQARQRPSHFMSRSDETSICLWFQFFNLDFQFGFGSSSQRIDDFGFHWLWFSDLVVIFKWCADNLRVWFIWGVLNPVIPYWGVWQDCHYCPVFIAVLMIARVRWRCAAVVSCLSLLTNCPSVKLNLD